MVPDIFNIFLGKKDVRREFAIQKKITGLKKIQCHTIYIQKILFSRAVKSETSINHCLNIR
jgi:hypothetical protein